MTSRRLVIGLAVLAIFAIAVSLIVPPGPSVEDAHAIPIGTSRTELEAKLGRPFYIRPLPAYCRPAALICVWELSDGFFLVNLDDDGRLLHHDHVVKETWFARKRKRLKLAFGW
jgi:hypothetical protein